jgi:hypothetical protein
MWNWQLNEEQYPRWDELVAKLAQQSSRMLICINPFLAPRSLLSNPGTRTWIKSVIRRETIEKAKASG